MGSPSLVRLYDVGQHDGVFYCAMEYVPGGSLAQPARPLDQRAGLRAVADAARAAAALHDAGVVHRQIKPGNVLLGDDGGRLSDVGLAHVFTPGVMLTGMGSVTSVEYSDPDLLRGERAGPHNDVWSLGVLVHRITAGVGVYGDLPTGDPLFLLRRILSATPAVSDSVPHPYGEIVAECLAAPRRRPSAIELANRLATALE